MLEDSIEQILVYPILGVFTRVDCSFGLTTPLEIEFVTLNNMELTKCILASLRFVANCYISLYYINHHHHQ